MRAVCALVDKRLGPRHEWYLAGFEIGRDVQDVLGAAGLPDSGQVRMAVRRSWRRRGEVGLAIRPLRNSAGRYFHPLAIDRRTNQYQHGYRRQNSEYTSVVQSCFHFDLAV